MAESVVYGYSPTYTELTPVELSPNTEVKVPYTGPGVSVTPDSLTAVSMSSIAGGGDDSLYRVQHMSDSHYQQLLLLFRGLPKVMFVDRLLSMYSTCETSLDRTRGDLFAMVERLEGFPVGSTMKRRVPTRTGSTVPEKLSNDVHTLLAVLDGAGFAGTEVKELLNCPRRKRGRSVNAQAGSVTGVGCSTPSHAMTHGQTGCREYALSTELKGMGDSIVGLKADILNIRQMYAANETARTKQISVLKETVMSLKTDISQLVDSVNQCVSDLKLSVQRIETETGIGVTRLKNEIKQIRSNVKSLEDSVYDLSVARTEGGRPKQKSPVKSKKGKGPRNATCTVETQGESSVPVEKNRAWANNYYAPLVVDDSDSELDTVNSENVVCCDNQDDKGKDADLRQSDPARTYADVTVSHTASSVAQVVNGRCSVPSRHAYAQDEGVSTLPGGSTLRQVVGSGSRVCDKGRSGDMQNPIAVVVTDRSTRTEVGQMGTNSTIDDFVEYVRKRTRRFYVKGFKSTITEGKIAGYVKDMGLKATKVTIFRSRHKPVVIRLNVEDAGHVSDLEEPWFWPRGVVCRPWYSWGRYQQNYSGRANRAGLDPHHSRDSWGRDSPRFHSSHGNDIDYSRSDITDFNPYLWYWGSD